MPEETNTLPLRERVARAICAAHGDDWGRGRNEVMMETYGPLADAAIAQMPNMAELKEALEPFANFAVGNVDQATWSGVPRGEQNQTITTWFGPSDFQRALETYLAAFGRSGLEESYEIFGEYANSVST